MVFSSIFAKTGLFIDQLTKDDKVSNDPLTKVDGTSHNISTTMRAHRSTSRRHTARTQKKVRSRSFIVCSRVGTTTSRYSNKESKVYAFIAPDMVLIAVAEEVRNSQH